MNARKDKVAGKVKELRGKFTGDRDLEAEGQAQRIVGKFEEAGENAKDAVRSAVRALKPKQKA